MLLGAHISVAGGYLKALDYAQKWVASARRSSPRVRGSGGARRSTRAVPRSSSRRGRSGASARCSPTPPTSSTRPPPTRCCARSPSTHSPTNSCAGRCWEQQASSPTSATTRRRPGRRGRASGRGLRPRVRTGGWGGVPAPGSCWRTPRAPGRTFGSNFEELGACITASGLPEDRLGVCLDTCHAWAYGLPVDTAAGWREVIDGIAGCCDIGRLGLIHANDCLFERGSRKDRHAWIGDGFIGSDGFCGDGVRSGAGECVRRHRDAGRGAR